MADAVASYDQLAHQVEALRQENSHLRRELKDNCHHLSKLETETFGMKEVLKQLQYKLEQEAVTLASSGRSDVLHQLKGHRSKMRNDPTPASCLEFSYSPVNPRVCGAFRDLLLGQMDQEERERCWYFSQLEALTQRLVQLPRIDTFSLQMDLIRQQLEFEVQQVRSVMEERFGTQDQMVQRTQMRAARLEQLERELQEARPSQETQLQVRTSAL
uniref:Adenomatous polyposis coli N-terminal dimerisation domain-containing protein n=1 Tax=Neogobius melanostomus TaxID=47308 RepID=A0A8C6TJM2_9GOBI